MDENQTKTVEIAVTVSPGPVSSRPESMSRRVGDSPREDTVPSTIRCIPPHSTISVDLVDEEDSILLERATEKAISIPSPVISDRATLTVITGLQAGLTFALDSNDMVLGRGDDVQLRLDDPAVSRKHLRIRRGPEGNFAIEDLRTTNGTFVGGRRVHQYALTPGDRLQLGPNVSLRYAVTDDAEQKMQQRLYESSTRDGLTRAFNRKYFSERIVAEVAYALRHKTELTLLMIDLDRFKDVNDRYGHPAGDLVLSSVASQILRLIRVEDIFARYGGEEFAILARTVAHIDGARLAERVRHATERLRVELGGKPITVTVSLGVASLSEVSVQGDATELLALSDARLYRAKASGRNRVCSQD